MKDFEKLLNHYKEIFGLHNWTIELDTKENADFDARTFADPRYQMAKMTISSGLIENKFGWERNIIHELIHIVMALYDFFADNLGKDPQYTDELFFIAREKCVSELTTILERILHEKTN